MDIKQLTTRIHLCQAATGNSCWALQDRPQCRAEASIKMDDVYYCREHAGVAALGILIGVTAPGRTPGERERAWRFCRACEGEWPEEYAVSDALWREAGMEPRGGRLCFACLERRIGRPLTIEDFPPDLPVNRAIHFTYWLAKKETHHGH